MTLTTYEYTNNFVPPTEAYYRLTAKDGTYFVTKTPFWDATIRETTTRNKTLQPCTEAYTLHLPRKIDASTTIRAHAFFHTVKATHGTEALLLIFANPTTGEYDLVAPPQHNTPGSVTAQSTHTRPAHFTARPTSQTKPPATASTSCSGTSTVSSPTSSPPSRYAANASPSTPTTCSTSPTTTRDRGC